jgi:hypothetical protein
MAKQKVERCPYCDKDTEHKIKKVQGIDHSDGHGFTKYVMYHCLSCNRYYQPHKQKSSTRKTKHQAL